MRRIASLFLCVTMAAMLLTGCGGAASAEAPAEPVKEEEAAETAVSEAAAKESEAAETVSEAAEESSAAEEAAETAETTETTEEASTEAEEGVVYEPGTWEGTTYTNAELGFTVTLPETYTILTGEMLKNAMGQATDVVLEESDLKNMDMSAVVYDFMGIAPDQVTNIIFSVEDNRFELDSESYGEELLKSFDMMGVAYEMFADPETIMIGDIDFYEMDMALNYSAMTGIENNIALQSYLIHVDGDKIYYFTITFTEESLEEVAGILQSIQPIE